ncbi:hypothetical protein D9M69_314790 [compost metagenome]
MAPLTSTAPFTTIWSWPEPAIVPLICSARVLPAAMLSGPLMVRMPVALPPGASVPPLCTVTAPPSVPIPARVAPLPTVVAPAVLPLTTRVPAETWVVPLWVSVPVSVRVSLPRLVSVAPPEITPDSVVAASVWMVAPPNTFTLLSMVVAPPMVSVPPASTRSPPPRLASDATFRVPPSSVVVPV